MTYTPINWQTGDTITAEKLNNMEDGISNAGGLVVPVFTFVDDDNLNCDMTFSQVNAAIKSGKCFSAKQDVFFYQLTEYVEDDYFVFEHMAVSVDGVYYDSINFSSDNIIYTYNHYPQ